MFPLQAGQISYEEAILAKQQLLQRRKEHVQQLQEQSRMLMQQFWAQRREEQAEMRRLVEATSAAHGNVREARERLTAVKRKIGVSVGVVGGCGCWLQVCSEASIA